MSRARTTGGLLLAASLLLTGCGAAGADAQPQAEASGGHHDHHSMGSMESMQPMESMAPTNTSAHHDAEGARPSAAAKMICEPEIRKAVQDLTAPDTEPHTVTSWTDQLFTCTYHLPMGTLVLSVKDSPDEATGTAYFRKVSSRLDGAERIRGLESFGFPAYETDDGTVLFLKDGKTLTVDATRLPAKIGPHGYSPDLLAYAVASRVVACWTE